MGLAVDGLVSGLDTTSLINSLMKLEALPQGILKTKVSDTQSMIKALQGLNTQVASLADLAQKTAKPDALDLYTAKSSSNSVTTAVTPGASAGQIDVVVDSIAQSQVGVSAAMTAWSDPPVLTIVAHDGTHTEITPESPSLDNVVAAINAADVAVTATKVASGTAANGEPQFRIQFTGNETGVASGFNVFQGTSAEVAALTAPNVLNGTGAAVIREAQDAAVTLWAGSSAEQTINSSSNTFSNLLPGVSVTVSAVSADPVTITVARDETQISKVAADFVSALNGVFATISTKSVVTNSTDANGKAVISAGVFNSDSTVRGVNQAILSAASMPIDGRSPSEIGISITKTGTLEFDAEKFAKAMKEDPARVASVMQQLATRVADAANQVSDKYDGTITSKITGQESLVKNFSAQVADWDDRLTTRRATLERTYAALEVALSGMQSQMSWLSSQLGGLPSSS